MARRVSHRGRAGAGLDGKLVTAVLPEIVCDVGRLDTPIATACRTPCTSQTILRAAGMHRLTGC